MAASKAILPLVLQGRFDEGLTQAALMWDAWQRAGRPPARWMGPAAYAAVLAHGLRGDNKEHDDWLVRLRAITGTGAHRATGTGLASFAAFSDARIALHQGAHRRSRGRGRRPAPWAGALVRHAALVCRALLRLGHRRRGGRRGPGPDAAARLAVAAPAGAE